MADVLLFHHALGLTPGVHAFADQLRAADHRVMLPDLFEGRTFASIDEGVAHAGSIGFEVLARRGVALAEALLGEGPAGISPPAALVVAGFSLGVMPAQRLAQTRPGVRGAILYHGAVPASTFGDRWPKRVALQIHLGEQDPWAEEDREAAQALAAEAGGALFLYPGSGHLIAEAGFSDYHPEHAGLILERTLAFLGRL